MRVIDKEDGTLYVTALARNGYRIGKTIEADSSEECVSAAQERVAAEVNRLDDLPPIAYELSPGAMVLRALDRDP